MTMKAVTAAVLITLTLAGCYRLPTSTPVQPVAPSQVADVPEEPAFPLAQQQAILSAESYLSFSAWSRPGLIGQLEYEGFSTADATFAVDYLDVDWNAQAAASAESYLNTSSFSRQGLIDQLLYEGFTAAEAEHGVTAVGY